MSREVPAPQLRDEQVMGCVYGMYPWDDWQHCAHAHGVPLDLATLGRAVIREAWQHGWDEDVRAECGWHDDGRAMLALALTEPVRAEARWSHLLDTDGGRCGPLVPPELLDRTIPLPPDDGDQED